MSVCINTRTRTHLHTHVYIQVNVLMCTDIPEYILITWNVFKQGLALSVTVLSFIGYVIIFLFYLCDNLEVKNS